MLAEQRFVDRNDYSKSPSETSTPIDAVEWFAKTKGIVNLDDPSAKVRTIINDVNEYELAQHNAKKIREARAQEENAAALLNLRSGKAIHRQPSNRTNAVSKKPKPSPKVVQAKSVTPAPKKKRKPYCHKDGRKSTSLQVIAQARRKSMIEALKAGEKIELLSQYGKDGCFTQYQQQNTDLREIRKTSGLNIIRIQRIQDNQAAFTLDNFTRHEMEPVNGLLVGENRIRLINAVCSKELVLASSITKDVSIGARSMKKLACKHGFDIYTVFDGRVTIGWILMDEEAVAVMSGQ